MSFTNKICLVTGSSQGIGKSLAEQLAAEGATVVLNGRNENRLARAVEDLRQKGYRVAGLQGDVSLAVTCQRLVEDTIRHFGRLDILVNNAGVSVGPGTIEEIRPEIFERATTTNYLSAVYMTRCALPHLRASKGSVLFVSSTAGAIGFPENAAYCSAKMALTGFAEALRWELLDTGVHVGIAYVGYTENEAGKRILSPGGGTMLKQHGYKIKLVPIPVMTRNLLRMLQKRRFKGHFPFSGRMAVLVHHNLPWLWRGMLSIFLRRERRRKKKGEAEAYASQAA